MVGGGGGGGGSEIWRMKGILLRFIDLLFLLLDKGGTHYSFCRPSMEKNTFSFSYRGQNSFEILLNIKFNLFVIPLFLCIEALNVNI